MGIKEVFQDLYNLEINLIESRHMTGRKMETFSSGMAQTANKYAVFLRHPAFEPALTGGDETPTCWDRLGDIVTSSDATYSSNTFDVIATAAERVVDADPFDDDDERRGVAIRVLGVSQQLRFIAKRRWGHRTFLAAGAGPDDPDGKDPAGLTDAERLQIRKAWDIGTNVVVMQTVAQLDGDIIMRIAPSRESEEYAMLHQLNQQLVSTSLNHWRVLFETVATLAGSSFTKLLGR
jgi:hypothetical protein